MLIIPNSSLLAIFDIIDRTAIIEVLWNISIIPPETNKEKINSFKVNPQVI